ncbi:MAG: hypothetical protein VR74_00675 [Hyphomonas sp. BRH_c22]|nr:MAG: hypothetical protein VR74_00675 [Hyphomonas sp. BRH_c22]
MPWQESHPSRDFQCEIHRPWTRRARRADSRNTRSRCRHRRPPSCPEQTPPRPSRRRPGSIPIRCRPARIPGCVHDRPRHFPGGERRADHHAGQVAQ